MRSVCRHVIISVSSAARQKRRYTTLTPLSLLLSPTTPQPLLQLPPYLPVLRLQERARAAEKKAAERRAKEVGAVSSQLRKAE